MKVKDAILFGQQYQGDIYVKEVIQALIRGYNIRGKVTNQPCKFSQEAVDSFFKELDENGTQQDWEMISLKKVREIFHSHFTGIQVPSFPAISQEMKELRNEINN